MPNFLNVDGSLVNLDNVEFANFGEFDEKPCIIVHFTSGEVLRFTNPTTREKLAHFIYQQEEIGVLSCVQTTLISCADTLASDAINAAENDANEFLSDLPPGNVLSVASQVMPYDNADLVGEGGYRCIITVTYKMKG